MSGRYFSVPRRKAGMVDLTTPIRQGVDGYRLKAAVNWDQPFYTFLTAPIYGHVDPEVAGNQHSIYGGEIVRIIFKPSKYTLSVPAYTLSDTGALWLQLFFVINGTEQSATDPVNGASAPTLLSPSNGTPTTMQAMSGTAPSGASLANSLQVDFPRLVQDVRIRNTSATVPLWVAFDAGGGEFEILPGAESFDLTGTFGTVSSIWVRGAGGTCPMSMAFTFANPR